MRGFLLLAVLLVSSIRLAGAAGGLAQDYFAATEPGAWAQLELAAADGSKIAYTYTRRADEEGRIVLEVHTRSLEGPAAGSEGTSIYTMPAGFDLARDGLSYGRFAEKLVMKYGDMEMPVDDATLAAIRDAEKNYHGALTAAGTEDVAGLRCHRYTYALDGAGGRETGTLWLHPSIPFAIVRQTGRVTGADGAVVSEFDIRFTEQGRTETAEPVVAQEETPPPAAAPMVTTLGDGFRSGHIGLDVESLAGGKQLRLNIRNEYEAQMTVNLPAGPLDLEVGFPVRTLRLQIDKPLQFVLPGGASSDPLVVKQRGTHGIAEGTCYLSIYEGTPVFQGSVTMDQLPK